jgi:tRNA (guanine-N7-)-methyltransferase
LSDYAYALKEGGKLYTVTDVKDLYDWNVDHLERHPLFERLADEEFKDDVCIHLMTLQTDEAQKVKRNEGSVWHAVFRKRRL